MIDNVAIEPTPDLFGMFPQELARQLAADLREAEAEHTAFVFRSTGQYVVFLPELNVSVNIQFAPLATMFLRMGRMLKALDVEVWA